MFYWSGQQSLLVSLPLRKVSHQIHFLFCQREEDFITFVWSPSAKPASPLVCPISANGITIHPAPCAKNHSSSSIRSHFSSSPSLFTSTLSQSPVDSVSSASSKPIPFSLSPLPSLEFQALVSSLLRLWPSSLIGLHPAYLSPSHLLFLQFDFTLQLEWSF